MREVKLYPFRRSYEAYNSLNLPNSKSVVAKNDTDFKRDL